MVNAIGSSSFSSYSGSASGASAAGLEAQLARYQKVLSECVSCDSAKTREGKQAIQDAASKIREVKARIEEAATVKSNAQPAASNAGPQVEFAANKDAATSRTQGSGVVATSSASGLLASTVGSHLDVFA